MSASFSVTNNGTVDITAPTVTGIELKRDRVEVPAVIEGLLEGTDDVSGVKDAQVFFTNPETGKQLYLSLSCIYYDYASGGEQEYADGKLHGELEVSHYTGTGDYVIDNVIIYDKAGNYQWYYGMGSSSYEYMKENEPERLLPESLIGLSFYVYNDGKGFDVTASTTTPDLLEQINNAEDGAEILVDYSNNTVLEKDIFEAVQGTEKTLSLVSEDGVQWVFHGTDIVNECKDIDLKVHINYITQSVGQEEEAIQELVDETKTVILQFPENGVLPGKATIRIKADYSMRNYLGEEGIYVYYFDNTANELVPIAAELTITPDYYIEFEIEHCSYYLMTAGAVETEEDDSQTPSEPENPSEPETPENNAGTQPETEPEASGSQSGQEGKRAPKTGETSKDWIPAAVMAAATVLFIGTMKKSSRKSARGR